MTTCENGGAWTPARTLETVAVNRSVGNRKAFLAQAVGMVSILARKFPGLDHADVCNAVADAVDEWQCKVGSTGAQPDPRHLLHAAWCNCANCARSSDRRGQRERRWFESSISSREREWMDAREMQFGVFRRRVAELMPDDEMRSIFSCWLIGERDTQVYVEALGLADASDDVQHQSVKRAKDRLVKFLSRSRAVRVCSDDYIRWSSVLH
ncbi:MAG: hypothetical protein WEF86_08970 [Gemmatimonadota bacterium]